MQTHMMTISNRQCFTNECCCCRLTNENAEHRLVAKCFKYIIDFHSEEQRKKIREFFSLTVSTKSSSSSLLLLLSLLKVFAMVEMFQL